MQRGTREGGREGTRGGGGGGGEGRQINCNTIRINWQLKGKAN